ncbi:hypothetical protein NYG88_03945 [Campylobacter felis]|nr:hypothetical protein [Campylobacter felis]
MKRKLAKAWLKTSWGRVKVGLKSCEGKQSHQKGGGLVRRWLSCGG